MSASDTLLLVVIVLVAAAAAWGAVCAVPQQWMYVVERLGRYHRTLRPGLNVLVPFVDRVRARVDLREQVVNLPLHQVSAADGLDVWVGVVLYFRIADPVRVTYEVTDVAQAMDELVANTVRAAINPLDRATALTSRGEVERQLAEVLREEAGRWGVAVTRGAVRDLSARAHAINEDSTSTVRRD